MSTHAAKAARRPAVSFLLQRILSSVFGWFRAWRARRPAPTSARSSARFESLEPRLLMSADLVGAIPANAIPADVLPSETLNIPVTVQNIGRDAANLTPAVRVYASASGQLDSSAVVLGESATKSTQIKAGKSTTVNVGIDTSKLAVPGNFTLFAVVDATNKVQESNESNNTAVASKPLVVTWSFGNVPGHSNSESITLTDADGTRVTFKLTGAGRGEIVRDGNAFDLKLTGTNSSSALKITTSGGDGIARIDDIVVAGSIKEIIAGKADLTGALSVAGTLRTLELRNIEDGASIAITGTNAPVSLTAQRVTGASIVSASAFDSICIDEWRAGTSGRGVISAPSIASLNVDGDFAADLVLKGASSGTTLGSVCIDGKVTGLWNVGGSAGSIQAKSFEAGWQGSFTKAVQEIRTEGNFSGTLATPSISSLDIGGHMTGANLLIGANLGNDGALGGTGAAADKFTQGSITVFRVNGHVADSSVHVGVNPVDGIFDNGNDLLVGGQSSAITQFVVAGKLLGTTAFVAGAFPSYVRINGQTVRATTVPQLHFSPIDVVGPQVALTLANDSGASETDGITWDPTLNGVVADAGAVSSLKASVDGYSPSLLVNIKPWLKPDGSFVLDEGRLATILGRPLTDGAHTVYVQAIDAAGNTTLRSASFTLDRTVPAFTSFDLAPESDLGTQGDRLTSAPVVAFNGLAEGNTHFELEGLGITGITNADGTFRVEGVALTEGDNHFTVSFTDLAGNQTFYLQTIRLDSTAPDVVAVLPNDSGRSATDGITNDITLTSIVNDLGGIATIGISVDGGTELVLLGDNLTNLLTTLSGDVLEAWAGGLADGDHIYTVRATDTAGNVTEVDLGFVLDRTAPVTPAFDLAPESDTGAPGDGRTKAETVSLLGTAEGNVDFYLNGSPVNATRTGDVFRIDGVALALGDNDLTVRTVDAAGNESFFSRTIVREAAVEFGFPDLVASDIVTQVLPPDAYGNVFMEVRWTTTNVGDATARGTAGYWTETVLVSLDDIAFNGDEFALDFTFASDELSPGEEALRSLVVPMYDFIDWSNARILLSLDHDVDFNGYYVIGNQVIEKAAGEYNNVTLQDIHVGQTPPPVAEWPDTVLPVDGTAIGGSIAAGAQKTYTFNLAGPSRILLDSLSASEDLQVTIRAAGGSTLFSHTFATADAFGLGTANPLLQLAAGTYEVVIEGLTPAAEGEFAFRLLDVDATAEPLLFDGGPQLNERIERGDQTHVYQFQGTEGVQYIVGGPGDSTVDGALFWRLFDPSGQMIWTGTDEPTDILTFEQTGTYTLTVEGRVGKADSTLYNVYAFTPQDRESELPFFGLPLSTRGFLDAPGQVNTYTFTVQEDTALFFDGSLDVNGDRIAWALEDAEGNTIWSGITRKDSGANGTDWPTLKVAAGDYSLRISGIDGAAGWYSFRLVDVLHEPAPTIIPGQVDSGYIAPGFWSNLVHLNAEAGQSVALNLDVIQPDWTNFDAPHWILLDPEGNVRMSAAAEIGLPIEIDITGEWSIIVQGRQDTWTFVQYDLQTQLVAPGIGHRLDLAPSSDSGTIGDGHTAHEFVELTGIATPNTALLLVGTTELAFTDAEGRYSFHNVQLALGENAIRVQALDGTQANYFTTVVRDEVQPETGFPDLVVNGVWTEQFVDDFGQLMLRVHWTTTNTGTATALGRDGAWAESVHASVDDTPWNGDTWLGALKVTSTLAPGASLEHSIEVAYPSWLPEGFRVYVVTDDEQYIDGFLYANEVAEKTAGEYNNLVIQYIASGIPPAPLPESGPTIMLDGTAVGGSLGEGEEDVYDFHLDTAATLYFDALTSDGMIWTLREAGEGGAVLFSRSFEASDAFAFDGNPLLQLGIGDYELVIENELGEAGDYGFRLVDIDLAAVPDIVFDGGAIPRTLLERGDWTDIHQFHAEEGRNFVVGGPHDWNIDGALHWRLFDPAGNEIWSGTDSPSDETMFEMTGTYTLLVEGRYGNTDSAQYTAYVFEPQDRDIQLVTGERIQGFIDSPGQINTYHFSLDDYSSLFLDGYLESNGPWFYWTLRDSEGSFIESGNTRNDTTVMGYPRLLTLGPGDYTLAIEGQYESGGWYNFALFDLTHDAGIALDIGDPAIGALVPGFNSTMFRFDAQAGQAVTIDVNTMDQDWISYDPVHWMLVDENGSMVTYGDAGMSTSLVLEEGSYALLLQAHQYNWTPVQYSVSVAETGTPGVTLELAPESDTGEIGDLHTEQSLVALMGTAAPNALVTLEFLGYATTADETGAFRFENVYLNYGTNPFIVRSLDAEGNETVAAIEVVLDFTPPPMGSDLVASDVQSMFQGTDPSGNQIYTVSWTTTNQGANFASGSGGSWIESVYYSPFDDIIGNEDDILIGSETMYGGLNPGSYLNNTVWAWLATVTPEGRFYVVVDVLNDVIETPEGELNNVTMQA